jgi:plastocyanin
MRRGITITATLAVALVVSNPLAAGRATKTVEVDDDFFSPSSLTIKEKNTIDFNWVGTEQHNVQWKSGPGPYFQSDNFEGPGVHYSHKFKKPGNYVLGCFIHPDMLMDLKVKKRR